MTDKERIEKLLLTLKHFDNCLTYLKQMSSEVGVKEAIDGTKETLRYVIEANADEIDLDLEPV